MGGKLLRFLEMKRRRMDWLDLSRARLTDRGVQHLITELQAMRPSRASTSDPPWLAGLLLEVRQPVCVCVYVLCVCVCVLCVCVFGVRKDPSVCVRW